MILLGVLVPAAAAQGDLLDGKPAWLEISTDILKGKPDWLTLPQAPAPSGPVAPDGVTPAVTLPAPEPEFDVPAEAAEDVISEDDPVFSLDASSDIVLSEHEPLERRRPLLERLARSQGMQTLLSTGPLVEEWTPLISTGVPRRFVDPTLRGREPLSAITHVHSKISQSGVLELEELAQLAVDAGIDVFIPTDHAAARWEYGLWPLRSLLRRRVENPSVATFGAREYLARVRALGDRFPGLIAVPALEATPFYRWSGDLWDGLVLEDWHRHLIVLGLDTPEKVAGLPVAGTAAARRFDPFLLWPFGLLLVAGLFRKAHAKRTAWILAAVAVIGLLDCFPFRRWPESYYRDSTPWMPYQRVVDYVHAAGGISFWAHPESRSFAAGKKVSPRVTIRTKPYPSAVRRVLNHAGFGVFMEGWRKVAQPDGPWDGALRQHLRGSRVVAPWAFGELDFRAPGMAGTQIDSVVMTVLVDEHSEAGVVRAFKAGSFYAQRAAPNPPMVLERWTVSSSSETAGSGETLWGAGKGVIEVAVAHADGVPRAVTATLIRDGEVFARLNGTTPVGWRVTERRGDTSDGFYRLVLRDANRVRLVANPIFRRFATRPKS